MGFPVDFLDMGIYGPLDREDNRPKNSYQPNPAKEDLIRADVPPISHPPYR